MRWLDFLLCLFIITSGTSGIIVPDEIPTALSVIYSNIPKIKLGTDSRIGWGFRFGDRADAQILLELGPQQYTQRLANQQPFDNPNYPELTSSSDPDYDYADQTPEENTNQTEDVAEDREDGEAEATVIGVELKTMDNLKNKLLDEMQNPTNSSEIENKEKEVMGELVKNLEMKMDEEKNELQKILEIPEENDLEKRKESVKKEIKEIMEKLKKYVEKNSNNHEEDIEDIAGVEIDTLKRLIKKLSEISKDGQEQEMSEKVNTSKDSEKWSEEKTTHSTEIPQNNNERNSTNSNYDEKKSIVSKNFPKHELNLSNNSFQIPNLKIEKQDSQLNTTKSVESYDIDLKNNSVIFQTEKKIFEIVREIQPTNKFNNSIIMETKDDDQDEKNKNSTSFLEDSSAMDKYKINETKNTRLKLEDIEEEDNKEVAKKTMVDEEKKNIGLFLNETVNKPQSYEVSIIINDKGNEENIINLNTTKTNKETQFTSESSLDLVLLNLKIKLKDQEQHLNSEEDNEKFLKNMKILKILEEEKLRNNTYEQIQYLQKNLTFKNHIYKGVSPKVYEALSALWKRKIDNKLEKSNVPIVYIESSNKSQFITDQNEKIKMNETEKISKSDISIENNFQISSGNYSISKSERNNNVEVEIKTVNVNKTTKLENSEGNNEKSEYNKTHNSLDRSELNSTLHENLNYSKTNRESNNTTYIAKKSMENEYRMTMLSMNNAHKFNDVELKKIQKRNESSKYTPYYNEMNRLLNKNIDDKNKKVTTAKILDVSTKKNLEITKSAPFSQSTPMKNIKYFGGKLMSYFSKMVQDARKLNELKNRAKRRKK